MAFTPNDDFQMQLRPWLIRRLDDESFYGLRWENYAEKTYFRIPWNKMNKDPKWSKEFEVFRAWARNRGACDETKNPNWSELKSNFLNVMQKSNHFQEVPEWNVLEQQTGNYRVFRLLSQAEYKAKKKEKAHQKAKKGSTVSKVFALQPSAEAQTQQYQGLPPPESSLVTSNHVRFDVGSSYALTTTQPVPMSHDPVPAAGFCPQDSISQYSESYQLEISATCSQNVLPEQHYAPHTTTSSASSNDFYSAEDLDELIESLQPPTAVQQPPAAVNGNATLDAPSISNDRSMSVEATMVNTAQPLQCLLAQPVTSPLMVDQIVESFRVSKLTDTFVIKVNYRSDVVFERCFDLSQCHRLLYGCSYTQMHHTFQAMRDVPFGLDQTPVELPDYNGGDHKVREALMATDQGILLQVDQRGDLWAVRLCQSRVYFFKQDGPDEPDKMPRKNKQLIFSFGTYVQQLLNHATRPDSAPPEPAVKLHVGVQPHSRNARGLVGITVEPKEVDTIKRNLVGANGSSLPGMSEPDSIDYLIRQTGLITMQ